MWKLSFFIISAFLLLVRCHSIEKAEDSGRLISTLLQIKNDETTIFPVLDVLAYQIFTDDGQIVPHSENGYVQRYLTGSLLEEAFRKGIQEKLPEGNYHLIMVGYRHKQGTFPTLKIIDSLTDTLLMPEDGKPIDGDYFFGTASFSPGNAAPSITLQRKVGKVVVTLEGDSGLLSKISQITFILSPDNLPQAFAANDTYLNMPTASNIEYSQLPDENHQISFYSFPTIQSTGCVALIYIHFDGNESDQPIYILPDKGFYIAANHTTRISLHLTSGQDPFHPDIQVDTSWTSLFETSIDGEISLDPVPLTGFKLKISIPDGWDFDNISQNFSGAKSMYDFDYLTLQDYNTDLPAISVPIHVLDERTLITDIILSSISLTPYSWMLHPKPGGSAMSGLGVHNIKWTLPVAQGKIRTYATKLTGTGEKDIEFLLEEEIME